jgi:uncharacterized protein YwqG
MSEAKQNEESAPKSDESKESRQEITETLASEKTEDNEFSVEIIEDDDEAVEECIKTQFSENDIVESDFVVETHSDIPTHISKEEIDKELLYYDDSIADGFSDAPLYDGDEEDDVSDKIDAYIKELENFERGDTVDFDRAQLKK